MLVSLMYEKLFTFFICIGVNGKINSRLCNFPLVFKRISHKAIVKGYKAEQLYLIIISYCWRVA